MLKVLTKKRKCDTMVSNRRIGRFCDESLTIELFRVLEIGTRKILVWTGGVQMFNGLILILSVVEAVVIIGVLLSIFDAGRLNWASVVIGLTVGLINWRAPSLTRATLWLGPVFLLVMLAVFGAVAYGFYWYFDPDVESPIRTYGLLLLLLVVMALTGKSAAVMAWYALGNGWRWLTAVPVIAAVLVALFIIYDTFMSIRD